MRAAPSQRAFIGMGGNLGDVRAAFCEALLGLRLAGCVVVGVSRLYRSAAWVAPGATTPAPDYLNAACCVDTTLSARALLDTLHDLEAAAGRVRHHRWASRTLDLDLLLYGHAHMHEAGLAVPHPELAKRPFVLLPLADLAPDAPVPGADGTVADLLAKHSQPWAEVWLEADRGWSEAIS